MSNRNNNDPDNRNNNNGLRLVLPQLNVSMKGLLGKNKAEAAVFVTAAGVAVVTIRHSAALCAVAPATAAQHAVRAYGD